MNEAWFLPLESSHPSEMILIFSVHKSYPTSRGCDLVSLSGTQESSFLTGTSDNPDVRTPREILT